MPSRKDFSVMFERNSHVSLDLEFHYFAWRKEILFDLIYEWVLPVSYEAFTVYFFIFFLDTFLINFKLTVFFIKQRITKF